VQAISTLADERSEPGEVVTPSDLVNEVLAEYVAAQKKKLTAIAKQAEADELARVVAIHGPGDEAA
jgi:hypothetical protein